MKTLAAILVELGHPLELADLEIPALKPGQALIDVRFSGICHTQIQERAGVRGPDRFLPHALGHEGSGVVADVGPGVTKVKIGDRVILSWIKGSGADVPGTAYRWQGRTVNAGGITTFSRQAVISENRLTRLPDAVGFEEAALVGCAVATGVGAVVNAASARPGQSLVVFGVGGVGLCAIAGAVAAGCSPIIAVDLRVAKLDAARKMGASHTINISDADPLDAIRAIQPDGVDIAIEVTGVPTVMRQALEIVRPRGGTAVVVGNAPHGQCITIDPRQFNQGKRLLGTWGGDSRPDEDYPRYLQLLRAGKLSLGPLTQSVYDLPKINDAMDDLEKGLVLRPLVRAAA